MTKRRCWDGWEEKTSFRFLVALLVCRLLFSFVLLIRPDLSSYFSFLISLDFLVMNGDKENKKNAEGSD